MDIAASLIRERTSRKLNKTQFARLLGVSKSRITEWEAGKFLPRQDRWERIATSLSITIEQLLGLRRRR